LVLDQGCGAAGKHIGRVRLTSPGGTEQRSFGCTFD